VTDDPQIPSPPTQTQEHIQTYTTLLIYTHIITIPRTIFIIYGASHT